MFDITKFESMREENVVELTITKREGYLFGRFHYNSCHLRFLFEPLCVLTSIPFFVVAWYFKDPVVLFAAVASTLSHGLNLQIFHDLDILAVVLLFMKIGFNWEKLLNNKEVLIFGGVAVCVNVLDTFLNARQERLTGVWLHCVWHIYAAIALFYFEEMLL